MTTNPTSPRSIPETTGTYPANYVVGTNPNLLGKAVTFRNAPGETLIDEIDNGLSLRRVGQGGLINAVEENSFNANVSPAGTQWNADGWDNLDKVADRSYTNFRAVFNNQIGTNIIGTGLSKLVMHDTINNKYYKVEFHFWQYGNNYGGEAYNNYENLIGGWSYTRQQIFVPETVDYYSNGWEDAPDTIREGLTIKRESVGGIYNSAVEENWNPAISPVNTLWNSEGWGDLSDFETREYHPLFSVTGPLGNFITDKQYIMFDVEAKEYYKVDFYEWGSDNGGTWGYKRTKLNKSGNPSGIVFGDGSVQSTSNGTIPQNRQSTYENYMLQLSDAGKHIYKDEGDGYGVVIPEDRYINFPIGTAITVVSGNSWTYFNVNNSNDTELWGAGYDQTSTAYYIPNNSMATLLKIGPNKWMVSGAGLAID